MKKVFLVLASGGLLFALAACNGAPQEPAALPETEMEVVDVSEQAQTVAPDMHNAANALDYAGVYEGLLPAADGPGIQTTVTLNPDGTFVWNSEYLDEEDGMFTDKGTYTLQGNIAQLDVPGEGARFLKVEEGRVRFLDQQKNVITGPLADSYVLTKK